MRTTPVATSRAATSLTGSGKEKSRFMGNPTLAVGFRREPGPPATIRRASRVRAGPPPRRPTPTSASIAASSKPSSASTARVSPPLRGGPERIDAGVSVSVTG